MILQVVLLKGVTSDPFEMRSQVTLGSESQIIGDFNVIIVRICEKIFRQVDLGLYNILMQRNSFHSFKQGAEIIGMHTQMAGNLLDSKTFMQVHKNILLGKQKTYIIGSVFAIIGGTLGIFGAKNMMMELVALTIRSMGTLPITYLTLSMAADGSFVAQTEATQKFFIYGMYGIPAFCAVILFVIFCFFNLEKKLPQIREELEQRRADK